MKTVGIGLTVMEKVSGAPGHPPNKGVTIIVDVSVPFEVFMASKAGICEMVPLPPITPPLIEVLLLVHWYVTPFILDVNILTSVFPLHM